MEIADPSVFHSFVKSELENPSARKTVNGHTIYASRSFNLPKIKGKAILGDLGSAARGDQKLTHFAQPPVYRSPEVILQGEWGYSVDIWNVGCMVWDLFEGKHLFRGKGLDGEYSTSGHLAEIIGILGPPPMDVLENGELSKKYFDEDGKWVGDIDIPTLSLEDLEENEEVQEKEEFLRFMKCMLQWRPEDRRTAKQLLNDPYLEGALK